MSTKNPFLCAMDPAGPRPLSPLPHDYQKHSTGLRAPVAARQARHRGSRELEKNNEKNHKNVTALKAEFFRPLWDYTGAISGSNLEVPKANLRSPGPLRN